jgi:hypothetical protein
LLEDHLYDLMSQTVQESQSLWRIKNEYKKNAKGYSECLAFWEKLEKDKEQHIEDLTNLIRRHLK